MPQNYSSANTSINSAKVPRVFHKVDWREGDVNLDYGGGKYNTASEYLCAKGVLNLIYDPYNRSKEHNDRVIYKCGLVCGADSCTMSNVLNVIDSAEERQKALKHAKSLISNGSRIYITVYEGDKSGIGRATKADCYQSNRRLRDYVPEVIDVFGNAHVHDGMIVAVKL